MDQVKSTVKLLQAGLYALGLESPIEVEQESDTEFNLILNSLGVGILIDTEGTLKRGIGGAEFLQASWEVYSFSYEPATRDEPEGMVDMNHVTHAHIADAIINVFEIVARDQILNMLEAQGAREEAEALGETV